MAGHWELWHVPSRNLLDDFETESEALDLVRELVGQGAKPDERSLGYDDPGLDVEQLPPAVTGAELAKRAGLSGSDQARRTA